MHKIGGASDLRYMQPFMIIQMKEKTTMFEDMAMLTIYGSLNAAIIMLAMFTWHMFRIDSP